MKTINKILASRVQSIRDDQANLKKIRANKDVLNTWCAIAHAIIQPDTCPKSMNYWDFNPTTEMEVHLSHYNADRLEVTANVKVDSFKSDAVLYKMLERAKSSGMKYEGHEEHAQWEEVCYNYSLLGLKLQIRARLKEGSTSCRRVEVSRKIVEREEVEYKLVCDQ